MAISKLQMALDILSGKTVVGHDRRKADAPAIPFTQDSEGKFVTIKPMHGISDAMLQALRAVAVKVEFVAGKRKKTATMPVFYFRAA